MRPADPERIEAQDVALKDPEYEITRSIRKLAGQYAGGGNLLARLDGNVELTAYASPKDQLPKPLTTPSWIPGPSRIWSVG
ncbi:hypothetical protein [Vreelandella utahensis]|uniref:hypothetical protein n=1 Tax=Vreelandella halophila TaxID=86177 RepID=UPI00117A3DEA|nr:hypothetical protein [Halomonas utahensis]